MSSTFLTAEWRKLIMAQYAVEPAILQPHLPPGTELDLYEGACLVSLVGFLFDRVRLRGIPIPFHTRFEEINLRFYVRYRDPDGTARRGVVFISELVPRSAISFIARTFYEEPYSTVPTHHTIESTPHALKVAYSWRHKAATHRIEVTASPAAQPILPGSLEEFITEHYWGFTRRSNGTTSQYEVRHPSWQVYPIHTHRIEADFASLYGPAFANLNAEIPHSVLLAEGSTVSVHSNSKAAIISL